MPAPSDIDSYLAGLLPDQRQVLQALRAFIHRAVPDAEETISYAMPGFRRPGSRVFAGFAANRNCGYYPHSGNILPRFADRLAGYKWTPGAVQFTPARPLPEDLLRDLVAARLAEIG